MDSAESVLGRKLKTEFWSAQGQSHDDDDDDDESKGQTIKDDEFSYLKSQNERSSAVVSFDEFENCSVSQSSTPQIVSSHFILEEKHLPEANLLDDRDRPGDEAVALVPVTKEEEIEDSKNFLTILTTPLRPTQELLEVGSQNILDEVQKKSNNADPIMPRIFICGTCDATFDNYETLKEHDQDHIDVKPKRPTPTERQVSIQKFKSDSDSDSDSDSNSKGAGVGKGKCPIPSSSSAKSFKCTLCTKTFGSSKYLRRHMGTVLHTGQGSFECSTCFKKFAKKEYLKLHMRSHTGERPFPCPHCPKTFATKFVLQTHLRTHTGEKPHECKLCGRGFAQSATLNTHIATHTGEKPNRCSVCSMTFKRSRDLKRHTDTIHRKIKAFECKVCGKKFGSRNNLGSHVGVHHSGKKTPGVDSDSEFESDKPHKCKKCPKAFCASSSLRRHLKEMHALK